MASVLNFYIDDSGTRNPDRKPGKRAAHGYDWFALGGVLVEDETEPDARRLHADFCRKWEIGTPIHSVEVRGKTAGFGWLAKRSLGEQNEFLESLYQLLRDVPVLGLACVIDRPGYNKRYAERYAGDRWMMCKTAFNISVERAAKYALAQGRRLRIAPERCNKREDRILKGYYETLKKEGMPFSKPTSEKYGPLSAPEFGKVLYEFRPKFKASPMAQLADLYLWPMCMGGYHSKNRPYQRLIADGKLIECRIEEKDWPQLGTKYSCFEGVDRQAQKPKPAL